MNSDLTVLTVAAFTETGYLSDLEPHMKAAQV